MTFIALARLRFGEGWIEPGETVPVEPGRQYAAMVQRGEIALFPDEGGVVSADEIVRGSTRDELEDRADEAGVVDPEAARNKDELAEAIAFREELSGLSRRELDRRAVLAGVDSPDRLANKAEVVDAIVLAQEADPTAGDADAE